MTAHDDARGQVRRAVREMTANVGDPLSAFHDPLKAITALRDLRAAVTVAERDAARRAREDGQSWDAIGDAMGVADITGRGAIRAFRRAASEAGSGPVAAWTCACGGLVLDRGPFGEHPSDAQPGHAEGCERFAAAVRDWEASGAGDDPGVTHYGSI